VNVKEYIVEYYGGHVDGAPLFADGLDSAIIGICPKSFRVVYSRNLCVDVMVSEGMTLEDAIDYLEYNTFNAYVGEYTPIWIEDFKWDNFDLDD
jgi:hypothetical protein